MSQNGYAQKEQEIASVCVPVTSSIRPPIVVPNPSMDTLKYGDRYRDVANPVERMLVKKNPSSRMAGTKQYWNQMTSSELENDVSRELL